MGAPVYKVGDKIVRVCYDGWMFELTDPKMHNINGRELNAAERKAVNEAIWDKTAIEIKS